MPRANPKLMARAVKEHRKTDEQRKQFDGLFDVLLQLAPYLEMTKNQLWEIRNKALELDPSPEGLVTIMGLNPLVSFMKTADTDTQLVKVLHNLTSTDVWDKFCDTASKSASFSTILFFTLRGNIQMCITNAPVLYPAGELYHAIRSGNPRIPDVVMIKVSQVPKFIPINYLKG